MESPAQLNFVVVIDVVAACVGPIDQFVVLAMAFSYAPYNFLECKIGLRSYIVE